MENPPPSDTTFGYIPLSSIKTFSKAFEFQKIVLVFEVYLTTYVCRWFCCFIVLYVVFVKLTVCFIFFFAEYLHILTFYFNCIRNYFLICK